MMVLAAVAIVGAAISASARGGAQELALVGVTGGGSHFELKRSVQRSVLRRDRFQITLAMSGPHDARLDEISRLSGPPLNTGHLVVATDVMCRPPRETLVYGQLPPEASRLELELPAGERLQAAVMTQANGPGLYFVSRGGVVRDGTVHVFDDSGHVVAERNIGLAGDPCGGWVPGATGGAGAVQL